MARSLIALGAAAVLGLGVAACGGDDEERVTVGLITKQETNPFWVTLRETAEDAAGDHDVELLTAAGTSDVDSDSQIAALEDMTSRGAKGILIAPASGAVVPAIEKARAAGVTAIAVDTPTEPESAVDALFATDNREAGVLIGRYARVKADAEGIEPKIAMLDLSPGISSGELRHAGFLEGFGIEDGDPGSSARRTRRATRRRRGRHGGAAPPGPGHKRRLLDQRAGRVRRRRRPGRGRQGRGDVIIVSVDGG
jgi:fructose transport system substrate-binding protein